MLHVDNLELVPLDDPCLYVLLDTLYDGQQGVCDLRLGEAHVILVLG